MGREQCGRLVCILALFLGVRVVRYGSEDGGKDRRTLTVVFAEDFDYSSTLCAGEFIPLEVSAGVG